MAGEGITYIERSPHVQYVLHDFNTSCSCAAPVEHEALVGVNYNANKPFSLSLD